MTVRPYGTWPSEITADLVSEAMPALDALCLDGSDLYWLERRPVSGRSTVVRRQEGLGCRDVTDARTDVRSRVHEYGGGSFHVHDGTVYFVDGTDQQLHRRTAHAIEALTEDNGAIAAHRYAEPRVLPGSAGDLVAVRELHEEHRVVNDLVRIDGSGTRSTTVLVSGMDFYASPRPSPDGQCLAWLSWNHPSMPWTGTELWLGRVTPDGAVTDARLLAGGPGESIFQPEWSPDGTLHFVSDRTGWWNLYRLVDHEVQSVATMPAELGWPQWNLDPQAYCFLSADRIACLFILDGVQRLGVIEPAGAGTVREIPLPFTSFRAIAGDGVDVYAIASAPDRPQQVIRVDVRSSQVDVVRAPTTALDRRWLSEPEAVELSGEDGRRIRGLFYLPAHPEHRGTPGSTPPLILICHGGPTVQTLPEYRPGIQFWTSRGFAVLEINYRGSSGWGRDYRLALDGNWGLADVADCVDAARQLAALGRVDPQRMVIRGASAGGFTTLAALAASTVFAAGISYFGISDLTLLRESTHKFESHALDRLIGSWPDAKEEYQRRSPLERCDTMTAPLLMLHGREDRIVPVEQSELMARRLTDRGVYCRTVLVDGEGHGFTRQANVSMAIEAELDFLNDVLRPA